MQLVWSNKICIRNFLLIFLISLFFAACSKVNVVLLPEKDNKVGKIHIKNKDRILVVDKAYQQVEAIEGNSTILTKKEISGKFKDSFESMPEVPISYLLYFQFDSPKIVSKSNKVLKTIIKEAKKETTIYIEIIGHTDRAGDAKYNKKLSLRRANNISKILEKNGITKEKISIDYYGESNPIVKTRDGVPRKINRRVEVRIK